MSRRLSAALTGGTWFVITFLVVALLHDRGTGVRTGLAVGGVAAVLSWFVFGTIDPDRLFEELEDPEEELVDEVDPADD